MTDWAPLADRLHRALEPLHVVLYFAPEVTQGYTDLGLHPSLAYFPGRSAPMGAVSPGTTVATFYVFAPRMVELVQPACWATVSPEQVLSARHAGVRAALTRTVAAQAGADVLEEAAALALEACGGLRPHGRPLFAANADLAVPADPLMQLWHAATLLREHRGDGHVAALLGSGLDPVEAILTYGLVAGTTDFLRKTRGWTPEEWDAAAARLEARGLLADGALTDAGKAVRDEVEARTVAGALEGWQHLGEAKAQRLLELAGPLGGMLADLFPASLRQPRKPSAA